MIKLPLLREVILPRLNGIVENIELLRGFGALSDTEFRTRSIQDQVQHNLRIALEGVFHIVTHILSRVPGGRETEYKRMAQRFGELGFIDRTFADSKLTEMAGYRNRLTHFYAKVKPDDLAKIIRGDDGLNDIEEFLRAIRDLLEHPEKFGLTIE